MRKSLAWSALAIIVVSGALPVVLGQVETAPSLVWTRTFTGTAPSQTTVQNGVYEHDSGSSSCVTGQGDILDIDWLTNAPWVAYTDGNGVETGGVKNKAILTRLSPTTGGSGLTQSASAAFDVAGCGVALDQRGRVYVAYGPCDTTNAQESLVLDRDGNLLHEFACTQLVGATTESPSFFVDVLTDPASNATRFSITSSAAGTGTRMHNLESEEDTAQYTPVCEAAMQGSGSLKTVNYLREPGTVLDRLWTVDTGSGHIRVVTFTTCADNIVTAAAKGGDGGGLCYTSILPSIDCLERGPTPPETIRRNAHDETDTSTAVTVVATDVVGPDPYDDGLATHRINEVQNGGIDTDGDYIVCGRVLDAGLGNGFAFLAAYDDTFATLLWNVTISTSTFISLECDLGDLGEIYWTGATPLGQLSVRKYCCNTGDVLGSDEAIEQIEVPGATPTPTPGALFNIDGNTIPGVGAFGANLFFGVLMIAGMTVSMGASPMAFSSDRSFRFSTALAVIGAVLGFFMAWAFGFLSTSAVFVVVILAIVIIGFYVVRRSG